MLARARHNYLSSLAARHLAVGQYLKCKGRASLSLRAGIIEIYRQKKCAGCRQIFDLPNLPGLITFFRILPTDKENPAEKRGCSVVPS